MIKIVFLAVLALSFLIIGGYLLFTILFRPGRKKQIDLGSHFPRVAILKPMKNLVDDIMQNLESYFSLDYPNYEILFGLDAPDDASLPAIRYLQSRFPEIPVRVLFTGHSDEENPKIYKLAKLEAESRGELLWVTDANTRVAADTLNRLVLEYSRAGSHLIFSPIRGVGSRTLASLMENMSLNLFTSGNILTAWKMFGQQIIVGKSILIEKAALAHFGGFSYFSEFLAEDFVIGEAFEDSGFKLSCSSVWIDNVSCSTTTRGFFRRMVRWAKLRLRLKPGFYVMEVLLNPVALSLALPLFFPVRGWLLLAAVLVVKAAIEFASYRVLTWRSGEPLRHLVLLPLVVILKDLILLAVYFIPFFSRTIVWQGGGITIGRRTRIGGHRQRLAFEGA